MKTIYRYTCTWEYANRPELEGGSFTWRNEKLLTEKEAREVAERRVDVEGEFFLQRITSVSVEKVVFAPCEFLPERTP